MTVGSLVIICLLDVTDPAGLEKYTAAVPRQAADGNFVPIYDMGSSMQGSQCLAVTDAELAKQVLTQVNDFKKFPEVYDSLKVSYPRDDV